MWIGAEDGTAAGRGGIAVLNVITAVRDRAGAVATAWAVGNNAVLEHRRAVDCATRACTVPGKCTVNDRGQHPAAAERTAITNCAVARKGAVGDGHFNATVSAERAAAKQVERTA